MRSSVSAQIDRLEREAAAYDELLLARLNRIETELDVAALLSDEDVLVDTALYHAAAERKQRARRLALRERLLAITALAAGLIVIGGGLISILGH